jgi:hypothetical protein
VITAEPRAEPTPTPSADPAPEPSKGSDTVEPVQRPATAAKGGTEDAPASVTKSALTPVTAAQAEPVVPKKPKIRYVRVPKAATEPARN